MADFYQTVIDTQAGTAEADHLARHVVSYLAAKGVIASNPSEEGGYPRGPNAMDISEGGPSRAGHEALPPVYSHLQVIIGRATHSGDMSDPGPPKASCPRCRAALDDPDEEWSAAVQAWLADDRDSTLLCAACGAATPVTTWRCEPACGFGNLAFRFWNWPPLRGDFLEDLGRELGHAISVVRGKL
ncbi:MAG: hypothetical protein HY293_18400 [Planctomycetes bacterium]|nr:hypothetical protein [Planctomycetota bacterium]